MINLSSYIIEGILPKCNLLNKNFSLVYFYILTNQDNNINNKLISKNLDCCYKSVLKIIKYMNEFKLINNDFKIINNNLNTEQAQKIINSIDKKIINENSKLKTSISFVNKNINFNYTISIDVIKYLLNKFKDPYSILFYIKMDNTNDYNYIANTLCVSYSTYYKYCIKSKLKELKIDMGEINLDNLFISCPVCGKEFDEYKQLVAHINRSRDTAHKYLSSLIGNAKITPTYDKFNEICELNKNNLNNEIKKAEESKKNKKVDVNGDLALKAVKYFYGKTNTKSSNWNKDKNLLKSHLNTDMNYDEIIIVLDYMIKTGSQDLRYFNSSINTAITIAKCKKEYRTEGTDSYLIAYFHKKTGQKLTDKIMLQGMKKITELKNEGYNYDQIEITIEYMIEKKVNIFNFINNYIEEALKNGKTKAQLCKNYSPDQLAKMVFNDEEIKYGIITIDDKLIKKEILYKIKNDLINGEIDVSKVNEIYNKFTVALAKLILKEKKYSINYNEQQWLSKIKL